MIESTRHAYEVLVALGYGWQHVARYSPIDETQGVLPHVSVVATAVGLPTATGSGDTYEEALNACASAAYHLVLDRWHENRRSLDAANAYLGLEPAEPPQQAASVMDVLNRVSNDTWDEWWESLTDERRTDWSRRVAEAHPAPQAPPRAWEPGSTPMGTPSASTEPPRETAPAPSPPPSTESPAPAPPHQRKAPAPEDLFNRARKDATKYETLCKWIGQATMESQFVQLEAKFAQMRSEYSEEQRKEVARLLHLHRTRLGLPPF